jgi:hypothetical protein
MLGCLDANLAEADRRRVKLPALLGRTFQFIFEPSKDVGPNGLETEKAAIDTPGQCGSHSQQEREKEQGQGEHPEILRQYGHAQNMKLPIGDIKEDRLATVPLKKGPNEVNDPERTGQPFDRPPITAHAFGMNDFVAGIDMPVYRLGVEIIYSLFSG